ncbi:MAG: cytochrome b/b6 domain-containing protein [Pseudomonadota bacterium]|nr:MAG: cytochrome b/b6 domain-containing protein [Pseudomonadota bacterium]
MASTHTQPRQFVRLTKSQRIQHAILFVSTALLIITGFMIEADRWFIASFGSAAETIFWWRGWIHRIAGVAVTVICIYHLIYVTVNADGRSWFKDMLPRPSDAVFAWQNIMFMLGFRDARPKMDRFFYLEKLEYWSVYFGMFIVIVTGIMLWTEYLWPKFYLDVAGAFHLGEATLAALAIIIGHIFSVHYNAHVYPMNRAFLDGMISEELMKEEHGLWYEREMAKHGGTPHGGEPSA